MRPRFRAVPAMYAWKRSRTSRSMNGYAVPRRENDVDVERTVCVHDRARTMRNVPLGMVPRWYDVAAACAATSFCPPCVPPAEPGATLSDAPSRVVDPRNARPPGPLSGLTPSGPRHALGSSPTWGQVENRKRTSDRGQVQIGVESSFESLLSTFDLPPNKDWPW